MGPAESIEQEQIWFCAFCRGPGTTRHHLVPVRGDRRGRKEVGVIRLCWPCHEEVNRRFTNDELEQQFNTEEKLRTELERRRKAEKELLTTDGHR